MTLIERLDGLTGPCRECDFKIGEIAIGLRHVDGDLFDTTDPAGPYYSRNGEGYPDYPAYPAYTASIDVALTLVPDGCMWNLGGKSKGGFADAGLYGASVWVGHNQAHGEGPTPAIALCIAALTAMDLDQ